MPKASAIKSILVLLIFVLPLLIGSYYQVMQQVMGWLLIVISAFKITDIKHFSRLFANYDCIAQQSRLYSVMYPFLEMLIGFTLLFVREGIPVQLALLALIVLMGTTLVSPLFLNNKQQHTCACLGIVSRVLDIPVTTVTRMENVVMIVMAVILLV